MRIFLVLLTTALAVARPGLSGNWQSQNESLTLRETSQSLEINGHRHPIDQEQQGPEPGSSNFLLTRLTRTADGYHLYSESRRTTQEPGEPIRVIFTETDTDYQLTKEGKLRVTTLYENGTRRLVAEYTRVDD